MYTIDIVVQYQNVGINNSRLGCNKTDIVYEYLVTGGNTIYVMLIYMAGQERKWL